MNLFVRHAFCFCKTGDDKKGFQSPPPPATQGKIGPKKKRRKTESETWVPPPNEHKDCSLQAIFVVIRPKSTFCQALHCLACKNIIPLVQKSYKHLRRIMARKIPSLLEVALLYNRLTLLALLTMLTLLTLLSPLYGFMGRSKMQDQSG